jgi:hypothetical protein
LLVLGQGVLAKSGDSFESPILPPVWSQARWLGPVKVMPPTRQAAGCSLKHYIGNMKTTTSDATPHCRTTSSAAQKVDPTLLSFVGGSCIAALAAVVK